ncbi:MAG: hypothetical protein LC794_08815 [Acidobacteria bacterium]|nr:hypothetical protein [Acidobacteriota bacterium]
MTRKPLRTCLLLLALLLVTSSSAYADAISVTSVSVSNIQLVTSSGTIVFSVPPVGSRTIAHTVIADGSADEVADDEQSPTRSEASTTTPRATANAVSDFTNFVVSANSSVMLSGCRCSAEAEGQSILRTTFTIVGGTGNVDVNFSALLQTAQNLMTDPFSLGAASDASLGLSVFTADTLSSVINFSFDPRLVIGPNSSTSLAFQQQLSQYWPCNSISHPVSTYSFAPTHGQHKVKFQNRHQ